MIKLIFGVIDDLSLLSYFLSWYNKQGVEQFIVNIVDQVGDGQIVDDFNNLSENYNVIINSVHVGTDNYVIQHAKRLEAQKKFVNKFDWVLLVDLDEFHEYPYRIADFFSNLNSRINMVQGEHIDRIHPSLKMLEYNDNYDLFDFYSLQGKLTNNIVRIPGPRISAVRGLLYEGTIHVFNNEKYKNRIGRDIILYKNNINIHHFKWRRGLIARLNKRINHFKKKGLYKSTINEAKRTVEYIKKNKGRVDREDLL